MTSFFPSPLMQLPYLLVDILLGRGKGVQAAFSHSSDVNLPFRTDVCALGLATVRREIANHKK